MPLLPLLLVAPRPQPGKSSWRLVRPAALRGTLCVLIGALAGVSLPTVALASPPAPVAAAQPVKPQRVALKHVKRLVLDPGHGGSNLGTVGALGLREKVICLAAAKNIANWLRTNSNLDVVLTREDDRDLALRERPRLANQLAGDALISIHANAHDKTAPGQADAHGIEVFFLAADASAEANRALIEREEGIDPQAATAELPVSVRSIVDEMALATAHRRSQVFGAGLAQALERGFPTSRFRGLRQAGFGVLKEARMPALVLELGYLTHPDEGPSLRDPAKHEQFGKAILQALLVLDAQLALEAARAVAAAPKPGPATKPEPASKPQQAPKAPAPTVKRPPAGSAKPAPAK